MHTQVQVATVSIIALGLLIFAIFLSIKALLVAETNKGLEALLLIASYRQEIVGLVRERLEQISSTNQKRKDKRRSILSGLTLQNLKKLNKCIMKMMVDKQEDVSHLKEELQLVLIKMILTFRYLQTTLVDK